MTTTFRVAAASLSAASLVLAGCSGGSDSSAGPESSASSGESSTAESAAFNDADVTFVQGMIPHHRGALAMAQLADGRAEDPRVLDLAGRIEAAHGADLVQPGADP